MLVGDLDRACSSLFGARKTPNPPKASGGYPINGEPQHRPQYTMIFIAGAPRKGCPILETPMLDHMSEFSYIHIYFYIPYLSLVVGNPPIWMLVGALCLHQHFYRLGVRCLAITRVPSVSDRS